MKVEFVTKLDVRKSEGGNMQAEAPAGDEAGNHAIAGLTARPAALRPMDSFAVIHDEPFFTIVYDDGEFRGTIVDANLDKLDRARHIAAKYHLEIYHVRCDYHSNFDLRLREVHVCN